MSKKKHGRLPQSGEGESELEGDSEHPAPDSLQSSRDQLPATATGLTLLLIAAALWLLLTGTLDTQELVVGALVTVVVGALAYARSGIFGGVRWSFVLPGALLVYLWVFSVALVRSNIDVARRVLSPDLPIRPGVVKVRTGLTSPLGRLLLANSITLTPGTLTVDVEDDLLTIHWIDCPPDIDMEAATAAIAGEFEGHLRRFVR
ncbi:MAG: Na+/H+ antiporter subunit E [Gallionellaceae bacterium]|nr:Na+/H+ antiporter subunit E [Gallionellaceae bacterium]